MFRFMVLAIALCLQLSALQANVEKVVVLGGGAAGLTAAIFAGQAHLNPLIVEGAQQEGQLSAINQLENYPGFPEGINGQEFKDRLYQQAAACGARFQTGEAIRVDCSALPFKIVLRSGEELFCESLIIATGTSPKLLGVAGEKDLLGRGISINAKKDATKFSNKQVVVVGGGDSAMEQALLLAKEASEVTIVYQQAKFYASPYLQERVLSNSKIKVLFNVEVVGIEASQEKHVCGITVSDGITGKLVNLACEGVFISNGRKPNTELFLGQLDMTEMGYVVTQPDTTKTSVSGVFVAGDIMEKAYRKVTTSTASGCMAAIDAAQYLKQKK